MSDDHKGIKDANNRHASDHRPVDPDSPVSPPTTPTTVDLGVSCCFEVAVLQTRRFAAKARIYLTPRAKRHLFEQIACDTEFGVTVLADAASGFALKSAKFLGFRVLYMDMRIAGEILMMDIDHYTGDDVGPPKPPNGAGAIIHKFVWITVGAAVKKFFDWITKTRADENYAFRDGYAIHINNAFFGLNVSRGSARPAPLNFALDNSQMISVGLPMNCTGGSMLAATAALMCGRTIADYKLLNALIAEEVPQMNLLQSRNACAHARLMLNS